MRWMWIDRFVEFISGQRAVAIKNVTLAEEPLDGYLPGFPLLPASLIVEGLAQTGGLLVGEANQFQERVVLAKIGKATFYRPALPGDTLRYTAVVQDIQPDGAIVYGTSHLGDELQAEVELFFAHLDDRFPQGELFDPAAFLAMLRMFGLYDIGRKPDGSPLDIPARYHQAEQQLFSASM
jgi:3-hydroxyacyl-[acyl-carrier-protein] dehydratase